MTQDKPKNKAAQEEFERKFWPLVDKGEPDSCWEWKMACHDYGELRIGGTKWLAHRLSWTIHFGEIPNGLCVLHKCDNPKCVNPDHLFIGNNADNVRDMVQKGRQAKGLRCGMYTKPESRRSGLRNGMHTHPEKRPPTRRGADAANAKLNDDMVREMRAKYAAGGIYYYQLAQEYGVSTAAVRKATVGETWTHVQ